MDAIDKPTNLFDGEAQDLLHVRWKLSHERLVAIVLAHVSKEDGVEWKRFDNRLERNRRILQINSKKIFIIYSGKEFRRLPLENGDNVRVLICCLRTAACDKHLHLAIKTN